jgi:hypothetical protein
MQTEIIFVVIVLILSDFLVIGIIPRLLGVYRPISDIRKILIKDAVSTVHMDITVSSFESFFTLSLGYGRTKILLTKDKFVVGARVFSYSLSFNTKSIDSYCINGAKVSLFLTIDGEKKFIIFHTVYTKKWADELEGLGITVEENLKLEETKRLFRRIIRIKKNDNKPGRSV